MRNMPYFGDFQPIDGRVSFLVDRAFKGQDDYSFLRYFSLNGDGIFTLVFKKFAARCDIYEVKTTLKKKRPTKEPIKDKEKARIIDILLDYCKENRVFMESEFDTIETYSKGITLVDSKEGLISIEVIKKRGMPK